MFIRNCRFVFTEFTETISVLSLMTWVSTGFRHITLIIYTTYYFSFRFQLDRHVFLECVNVTTL